MTDEIFEKIFTEEITEVLNSECNNYFTVVDKLERARIIAEDLFNLYYVDGVYSKTDMHWNPPRRKVQGYANLLGKTVYRVYYADDDQYYIGTDIKTILGDIGYSSVSEFMKYSKNTNDKIEWFSPKKAA